MRHRDLPYQMAENYLLQICSYLFIRSLKHSQSCVLRRRRQLHSFRVFLKVTCLYARIVPHGAEALYASRPGKQPFFNAVSTPCCASRLQHQSKLPLRIRHPNVVQAPQNALCAPPREARFHKQLPVDGGTARYTGVAYGMTPLTRRLQQVLDFIRREQEQGGDAPTLAEIASHFGFRCLTTAADHLRLISQKGSALPRMESRRGLPSPG